MFIADLVLPSALISLGAIGLAFGLLLALASKVFHVETDPKIALVEDALPGAQCGACGQPGCSAYAEAVVKGEAEPTLCMPGGPSVAKAISEILGVEMGAFTPKVAVVQCKGGKREAKQRAEYQGIRDCNAAEVVSGGAKACVYGCLGFGTCVEACPFDAMGMSDNALPVVFEDKCTGCGNCVSACPRGILQLVPRSQPVYLGCVSRDKGKQVKAVCDVGCTGCAACSRPKRTPSGKIKMGENHPEVPEDWEDYKLAVEKCPGKGFMVREIGLPLLAEEPGESREPAGAAS
jgi:RnfABCDGE-type electron transport complex B subunit